MYILFTGDDVGGEFTRKFFITINTELDLTGCVVQFSLCGSVKSLNNVKAGERREIIFSRIETESFGVGLRKAKLALFDSQGRYRTIDNDILVKCTDIVSEVYDGENNNLSYSLDYGINWDSIIGKPDVATKEDLAKVQVGLTEVTYAELKLLCDSGKLVAGSQYRITDYEATTTAPDTSVANHPFDIIVTANSINTLSESVRIAQHKGDKYFNGHNLQSWQAWYTIKNDTNRFSWADSLHGKGVIYRLIDENNNDLPFDFKNILWAGKYIFEDKFDDAIDASVDSKECRNVVVPRGTSKGLLLNRFSYYCLNIKLGADCTGNTFGLECHNITLGNNCHDNTFYGENQNITLGNFCINNFFKNNTFEISLGDKCDTVVIGGGSINITIGKGCSNIILPISRNVTIDNGVSLIQFVDLPNEKYVQNVRVESGVYNKAIPCTYSNMIYRDALTMIRPKGSYTLSV